MNKGVEILIERMGSNPDEFVPIKPYGNIPSKWREFIGAMFARKQGTRGDPPFHDLPFISDEDVEAFHAKLNEIRSDHFTKQVMATLLDTPDDSSHKEDSFEYKWQAHKNIGKTLKAGASAVGWESYGNDQLTQHMEAHLEQQQRQARLQQEELLARIEHMEQLRASKP